MSPSLRYDLWSGKHKSKMRGNSSHKLRQSEKQVLASHWPIFRGKLHQSLENQVVSNSSKSNQLVRCKGKGQKTQTTHLRKT